MHDASHPPPQDRRHATAARAVTIRGSRLLPGAVRWMCVAGVLLGADPAHASADSADASVPPLHWRSRGADDFRALGSRRTLAFVVAGGAAAGIGAALGDARDGPGFLDRPGLEGLFNTTNLYGQGVFLGGATLCVLGIGAATDNPKLTDLAWDLGTSLVFTGVVVAALKVSVNRTRPNGHHYSFPSGHSSAAFCVVPVLGEHLGWKVGAAAAVVGLAVAAGRVEDRRHYISDVAFGAGLGLGIGSAVVRDRRDGPELSLEPAGSSLALVARF